MLATPQSDITLNEKQGALVDTRPIQQPEFQKPCDVFGRAVGFSDEDQSFWWNKTAPVLGDLMVKAGYDIHLQYLYLSLYHQYIVPVLGPRPRPDGTPVWKSFLADDHTPFEPSWNCHGPKQTVRFAIEPIGPLTGTAEDPFNQIPSQELLDRIERVVPDLDRRLQKHLASEFFLSKDEEQVALTQIPQWEHRTQAFMAFDLDGGRLSTKAYFSPILKSLVTGISEMRLVSDAILRFERTTKMPSFVPALSVVEAWLGSFPAGSMPKTEMIAIDCVDPRKTRIKYYVRQRYTTFARVRDAYTLGGRLTGEVIDKGVETLRRLWKAVLNVPNDFSDDDELPHNGHRAAGTGLNYELKPGAPFPDPKIYVPVRFYGKTDLQVARGLDSFFEQEGIAGLTTSYTADLESLFPSHNLSDHLGTQAYISFSQKASGPYMTVYLAPRVYSNL